MDSLLQQPHELPDMLSFLLEKYEADLRSGPAALQEAVALNLVKVKLFVEFCREYLNEHRPVGLTHHDANYGIRLDNGVQFLLAPPVPVERGTVNTSGAVPITGNPRGAYGVDHRQGRPAVDKTAQRPAEKLDHKQPYKREQ